MYVLIITLLCMLSGSICAYPKLEQSRPRKLFLQLYQELGKGYNDNFKKNYYLVKHYLLFPYLEYQYLQNNIQKLSHHEIIDFEHNYPDFPLINKLRGAWLSHQARNSNWNEFLNLYTTSNEPELQCSYLWAKWQTTRDPRIFQDATQLWLQPQQQPKICETLFDTWYAHNGLSKSLIWQRIKLAIDANNTKLAKQISLKLSKPEQTLVDLWNHVNKDPYTIEKHDYSHIKHPAVAEIMVYGLISIAKKDPQRAIDLWQKIAKRYHFYERQWILIVRGIGLGLAQTRHPSSMVWLNKIIDKYVDDSVLNAKLSINIYQQNWHSIISNYLKYQHKLTGNLKWQYWYSIALAKTNHKSAAWKILDKLTYNRHYYGFLASTRLRRDFFIHHIPTQIDTNLLTTIDNRKNIRRAKELHLIGLDPKAVFEWRYAVNRMSDPERHAAAMLAARWQLPNWSILALTNSSNKDDLRLRFPQTYSNTIMKEAHSNSMDPAWIFAITRQESAFIHNAKSVAGALGLMQLLPSTAKEIARKNSISLRNAEELFEPHKNIYIGTKYLKSLLNRYENKPLLATTAYNAGIGRVKQWLPEKPLPADEWIELIPFFETRNYVQNVITFSIIYQSLLGNKPDIKQFMYNVGG